MKVEVDINLTPAMLAEAFCDMNDEEQAQVFIEIARIASATWQPGGVYGMQLYSVGRHLRDCTCSSEEARAVIREIASGIDRTEPFPDGTPP